MVSKYPPYESIQEAKGPKREGLCKSEFYIVLNNEPVVGIAKLTSRLITAPDLKRMVRYTEIGNF